MKLSDECREEVQENSYMGYVSVATSLLRAVAKALDEKDARITELEGEVKYLEKASKAFKAAHEDAVGMLNNAARVSGGADYE